MVLKGQIFTGLCYRAHNPAWSFSPLSGGGAKRHGGRFNPKSRAALYLSLSEVVALAEYQQGFLHRPQPSTLCSYAVHCENIVDLTQVAELKRWQICEADLACAWEADLIKGKTPASWAIANKLVDAGLAGIIVPSFASNSPAGGKNLVLWQWAEERPHQVKIIDDFDRLPRNQLSWQ